jgi:hypothetical protein
MCWGPHFLTENLKAGSFLFSHSEEHSTETGIKELLWTMSNSRCIKKFLMVQDIPKMSSNWIFLKTNLGWLAFDSLSPPA